MWELRLDPLMGDPGLLSTAPLRKTIEEKIGGRAVHRNVTVGTTSLATGATVRHDESELMRDTYMFTV